MIIVAREQFILKIRQRGDKMKSREYVKKFSTIKVKYICDKLNIQMSNVSAGTTSDKNYDRIKEEIENQIAKLYIKEGD